LFTVHRTWKEKLYPVASRLLNIIVENRGSTAPNASLTFILLPGIVGAHHLHRKTPVVQHRNYLLSNLSTTDDIQFSSMVLDSARELVPTLAAKRDIGRDRAGIPSSPNATRLRLRIKRLRRERPDGSAMQTVEELQNLLDQELLLEVDVEHLPTRYDVATVRSTLTNLCPPPPPTPTCFLKPSSSPSLNPSPLRYHPGRFFAPSKSYLTERLRALPDGLLVP